MAFIRPSSLNRNLESSTLQQIENVIKNMPRRYPDESPNSLTSEWQTIMSEDFEGTFPAGKWATQATAGYTPAYWDDTNYRSYRGSYSAWCADAGTARGPRGGPYQPGMNAFMVYGPFDLSDANEANMRFYFWNKSETDYDWLIWQAAITDGSALAFGGFSFSGDSEGWIQVDFDFTEVPVLGDLTGISEVFVLFFFLSDGDTQAEGAYVDEILLQQEIITAVEDRDKSQDIPIEFGLGQNYPNPFNPETTIRFELPASARVQLAVYDLNGHMIKQLVSEEKARGDHVAVWDGLDSTGNRVASGVYLYRLTATASDGKETILTRKLTFMK